ncbi:hypothetical protein COU57_03600 [Candidatus Pacearchaeota archaeon CG10_big_fil_rev_8_21_14_0_10_32_14]|nr:MAG: hypothetical protein COU57_03600 [Candidatus Pacearchaeota archaeon CG10_big_fil_rev_8_21_14_0_10_32_14]
MTGKKVFGWSLYVLGIIGMSFGFVLLGTLAFVFMFIYAKVLCVIVSGVLSFLGGYKLIVNGENIIQRSKREETTS